MTFPRHLATRLLLALTTVGVVVAVSLSSLGATDFRAGDTVVVPAGEVIDDDLYAAGETIRIDGTVRGDLITGGRMVTVNGTVEGDLMSGAQAVVVNGRVGDDVRIAGMTLQIGRDASIGDDVIATGFSLELQPASRALATEFARRRLWPPRCPPSVHLVRANPTARRPSYPTIRDGDQRQSEFGGTLDRLGHLQMQAGAGFDRLRALAKSIPPVGLGSQSRSGVRETHRQV